MIGDFLASISLSDLRNPAKWLTDWAGGGRRTKAGAGVGPETATALSGYYAAMRVISEDVGKLPLITYRKEKPRGKEELHDHPAYWVLLNNPNPDMTAMAFRETLTAHALGWGNGYAEIEFDGRGRLKALYPIHPNRVRVHRDTDSVDGNLSLKVPEAAGAPSGSIVYEIRNDDNEAFLLDCDHVLHVHGLGGNGLMGWSIARVAAESIGTGLAVQEFGNAFFGNGARPSGVIRHPGELGGDAQKRLRKQFAEKYQGVENTGQPLVFEEGMEWQRLTIAPEEAQWIQSKEFSVEEMARWFRVPPHKIQHLKRATFSNIESENIQYVMEGLLSWLVRWEQEIKKKIFRFRSDTDVFAKHRVEELLRGDQKSRSEYNRRMFHVGAFSQNDIRDKEGENPIEGGDTYYIPMNLQRAEDAASGANAKKDKAQPGAVAPEDEGGERRDKATTYLLPSFVEAAERVLALEANAMRRAAKKFEEDEARFSSWLSGWIEKQEATADDIFRTPAVCFLMAIGKESGSVDLAVRSHLEELEANALAAFVRGEFADFVLDWESRARVLAERIIDEL